MTFQLSSFRVGDRVRNRGGKLGTVTLIGRKYPYVVWDQGRPHGPMYSEYITEIVEAADGYRKVGGRK